MDDEERRRMNAERRDDIEAIQEAIDDMENGDMGIPFEEFYRDFRERHRLPSQP